MNIDLIFGVAQRTGGIATVLTDGTNLKKGDQVVGIIGWGEYIVVKEAGLRKIMCVPLFLTLRLEYFTALAFIALSVA